MGRVLISTISVFKMDAEWNYRQNIYVLIGSLNKKSFFFFSHVNFELASELSQGLFGVIITNIEEIVTTQCACKQQK